MLPRTDHLLIIAESDNDNTALRSALCDVTRVTPFKVDRIDGISNEVGLLVAISIPLINAIKSILIEAIKNRRRITIKYKGLEFTDVSERNLDAILDRIRQHLK